MDPKPFLNLAPERRLIMTYALRQSLEILQMTQLELAQWLQAEIERNPLLELNCEHKAKRYESEIESVPSLQEEIERQIRENFPTPEEQELARKLSDHLDEKGYLTPPESLAAHPLYNPVLKVLQTFNPPGIFARTLQESFLIQLKLKGKEDSLAYQIVQNAFEDLLHARYSLIKKKFNISDLSTPVVELSRLSLRPAHGFKPEPITPIHPDLIISKIEGGWTLELVEDELPKFQLNESYSTVDPETHEELEALRDLKTSAKWICRSLERRRKLLRELGKILLCRQATYLSQKGPLAQLTIDELTEKLQVHESTLSRALAGKYAATPRGIIPLRSLISSTPESENARRLLEKLVRAEDKKKPLTDEELAKQLKAKGYPVARRTIAKYRGQLKIGSAKQRKNLARPSTPDQGDGTRSPLRRRSRSSQPTGETPPESSQ